MMKIRRAFFSLLLAVISLPVVSEGLPVSASPEGAGVYIISPVNGAIVSTPVTVTFGLKGMGVAPAGTDKVNTGHHHLLVDSQAMPLMGRPMGAEVMHFGGGQTETSIELEPGDHTLQLILGDKNHIPHNPEVVSEKIQITVK
jgi:hypothetical protein